MQNLETEGKISFRAQIQFPSSLREIIIPSRKTNKIRSGTDDSNCTFEPSLSLFKSYIGCFYNRDAVYWTKKNDKDIKSTLGKENQLS
jgi:hypothetical protein